MVGCVVSFAAATESFERTLKRLELPEERLADPVIQEQLGRRAALLATSEFTWDQHLGPLYGWADVAEILGTVSSRQGVHDLAQRRRLLSLPASGGRVLYPAFQFQGRRTLPGLHELLEILASSGASGWTQASWFQSPQEGLGGETPVAHLAAHGLDERVLSAASRVAGRLAG
jgi:hypothetical protein